MKKKPFKSFQAKQSNLSERDAKVLQSLQKVFIEGGSVTYSFETKRIEFTKENPLGEEYITKSTLVSDIKPAVLFKLEGGKQVKRSFDEILAVFQDTAWDLGASSFEIG